MYNLVPCYDARTGFPAVAPRLLLFVGTCRWRPRWRFVAKTFSGIASLWFSLSSASFVVLTALGARIYPGGGLRFLWATSIDSTEVLKHILVALSSQPLVARATSILTSSFQPGGGLLRGGRGHRQERSFFTGEWVERAVQGQGWLGISVLGRVHCIPVVQFVCVCSVEMPSGNAGSCV